MQKNISLKRREVDYGQPKKLPSLERRGVRRQPDGAVLIFNLRREGFFDDARKSGRIGKGDFR